jgi:hypothetical protein
MRHDLDSDNKWYSRVKAHCCRVVYTHVCNNHYSTVKSLACFSAKHMKLVWLTLFLSPYHFCALVTLCTFCLSWLS